MAAVQSKGLRSVLKGTVAFFEDDFMRTLFPTQTNLLLVHSAADRIADYILKICQEERNFLPQERVYAAKPDFHFRRTVKLDVVAEFFLYDLVYRNRHSFRDTETETRRSFGYRFKEGKLSSASLGYAAFRAAAREASEQYGFGASFDVSAYFNSIYHHDLVSWFNDGNRSADDVKGFDRFLRQTNAGRSVDCLPQGIGPTKVIGSHFLNFVDFAGRLKSPLMLRFMDDVAFFADEEDVIIQDFYQIQKLLGQRGLSVNPAKTRIGTIAQLDVRQQIDHIKKTLLRVRRLVSIDDYGEEHEQFKMEEHLLSKRQQRYLLELLRNPEIDEEDAELVLSLLREKSDDVLDHVPIFLQRFPNLAKSIYLFCEHVQNKDRLAEQVLGFVKSAAVITEYQLFWLGWIAQNSLSRTANYGEILIRLYEHPFATLISRAKVLEIPEKRFGMNDLHEEHLRTGKSDWSAWASAVGLRAESKANRNHLLGYFGNGSPLNGLIADCVKTL